MCHQGFVVLFAFVTLAFSFSVKGQDETNASVVEQGNDPINAVVKLEVTTAKSDVLCPWINHTDFSTGSGVVIDKGRILTCAHCVSDATYIRVRKQNEDMLYHAKVRFTDDDADLVVGGLYFQDIIVRVHIDARHDGRLRLACDGSSRNLYGLREFLLRACEFQDYAPPVLFL